MSAESTIKLPEGNEIRVYEKSIVVGSATLFFNREPNETDIKAVKSIFVAGMTAKQSIMSKAYDNLMVQMRIPEDIS